MPRDAILHDGGFEPPSAEGEMQRDLVERAQRGDHEAFASLTRATIGRLDATARLILRDPELARDAVQEAYIRAWRDLPGLIDPDKFEAWLRRLVVHACVDEARRRRRRPIEVELRPLDHPLSSDPGIDVAARDELDRGFRHLALEHRAVLVLHYYLGLAMPEVASALHVPLGTAQSRLHRALASLRFELASEPPPIERLGMVEHEHA